MDAEIMHLDIRFRVQCTSKLPNPDFEQTQEIQEDAYNTHFDFEFQTPLYRHR